MYVECVYVECVYVECMCVCAYVECVCVCWRKAALTRIIMRNVLDSSPFGRQYIEYINTCFPDA